MARQTQAPAPKQEKETRNLPVAVFEISNVKWWNNTSATFNLALNKCITIYGMRYVDSKGKTFLSFPQNKGKDGKYWNIVRIFLADDVNSKIIKEVESLADGASVSIVLAEDGEELPF